MREIYFVIVLSFILTGCLPMIFTAASTATMTAAKDQSITETINDIKISAKINAAFITNHFKELYTKITVKVEQARVLLTGTIDKEEDALIAVQIAWDQPGVKEVINELIVDSNSNNFNLVQYTKDSMITSQIKTKTFFDPNIKFVNYTVVTVNNIVYLFGIARSEAELKEVASIASKIHGVKKVICHAKIQET